MFFESQILLVFQVCQRTYSFLYENLYFLKIFSLPIFFAKTSWCFETTYKFSQEKYLTIKVLHTPIITAILCTHLILYFPNILTTSILQLNNQNKNFFIFLQSYEQLLCTVQKENKLKNAFCREKRRRKSLSQVDSSRHLLLSLRYTKTHEYTMFLVLLLKSIFLYLL